MYLSLYQSIYLSMFLSSDIFLSIYTYIYTHMFIFICIYIYSDPKVDRIFFLEGAEFMLEFCWMLAKEKKQVVGIWFWMGR